MSKPSPDALARFYKNVAGHPLGGLLVEDLAASREHGAITARVGVAPDGNPVLYARDAATAKRLGEAVQHQNRVHVRTIPPLDVGEFRVLTEQASAALGAPVPLALTGGDAEPAAEDSSDGPYRVEVYEGAAGAKRKREAIATSPRFTRILDATRWLRKWETENKGEAFRGSASLFKGSEVVRRYDRARTKFKETK